MNANNGKIPFLDLVSLHQELEAELIAGFSEGLRTAGFVGGPMVEEFERDFADFCDATHCVGVAQRHRRCAVRADGRRRAAGRYRC